MSETTPIPDTDPADAEAHIARVKTIETEDDAEAHVARVKTIEIEDDVEAHASRVKF